MAKKQFKAESKRLLDLMINSIYTHKEIFLREIISNASDACDKLCYQALTDDSVGMSRKDFRIDLSVDKVSRIITVSDNGIGMDKTDLENNLGIIASSGSYKFKQEVGEDAKDTEVIGQFGVGFYSAFMVADQITVITRKYGSDTAYQWKSSGADGYTITECEKETVGTDIIMHIKADTEDEQYSEFLESWRLQELVRKYSDYIRFPIRMEVSKTRKKEGSPDDQPEFESYTEIDTLNSMVPIWQRSKSSVKAEEAADAHKNTFDFVKEVLGSAVNEVKASARLKSHPVCLTAGPGLSFEMEKYFQAAQPESGIRAQRILELNVEHPAFAALETAVTADPEKAKKYATLLYNQALLIAGLPLEDPSGYTDLVCELMK